MQQTARQSRIPEQQGIGQLLPPVPVGIDTVNTPSLPIGAMPAGTRLQVGKYQVIIHNFLAEGGFAHVYIARIEGKSGYVVLKRVAVPDGERLKMVEKEIAFMKRLGDHKNIVRYYESRVDALPIGGFEALILMEYCPGGGVIDLMNRRLQQRLTEPEILKIFSDVAEALAYMHYCNPPVLHRDLKVENILILNQDHYKLCDFGSASLSKGNYIPNSLGEVQKLEDDIQRHTTLQYRAPEMIDVYQKKPVNEKADIWAMGVLLYKLCYYTTPFEEEGQLATLSARYSIPNSPLFSEGLRHLVISMLQEDQNRRPNIYQVLNAICHLRGTDCPIRDIYTEPIRMPQNMNSYQHQQQQHSPASSQHHMDSPPSSNNGSIFEKIPAPAQEVPDITPMRRGRPTKVEVQSSPTISNSPKVEPAVATQPKFDPFDPSHVIKQSQNVSPRSSSVTATTTDHNRNTAAFQNSFIPEKISPELPTRVQSAPLTHHVTPKPQMATKILQTQPNSPVESNNSGNSALNNSTNKSNKEETVRHTTSKKEDNTGEKTQETVNDMPKINRGVSLSIEARFQAIKNASRGGHASNNNNSNANSNANSSDEKPSPTNSTTIKPKSKPAPPPKPARLRSNHIVVNDQAEATAPSVDDFENKFPSLEELDKAI